MNDCNRDNLFLFQSQRDTLYYWVLVLSSKHDMNLQSVPLRHPVLSARHLACERHESRINPSKVPCSYLFISRVQNQFQWDTLYCLSQFSSLAVLAMVDLQEAARQNQKMLRFDAFYQHQHQYQHKVTTSQGCQICESKKRGNGFKKKPDSREGNVKKPKKPTWVFENGKKIVGKIPIVFTYLVLKNIFFFTSKR